MSKIIEALENVRVFPKHSPSHSSPKIPSSETKPEPTPYQMTQQELADVYFSSQGKAKPADAPTVIRVVDRRRSYLVPWVISTVALALTCLALFTTKRIAISVNFEDASAPVSGAARPGQAASAGEGARVISISPLNFTFSKAAAGGAKSKEQLTVANHGAGGIAYAAVEFNPPLNAAGLALEFEARGRSGGETLEVAFRDIHRQSSLNASPLRPFPIGLTPRWEKARVAVAKTESFDATRIVQMRFEVGSQRTGNEPDSQVLIRNIRWVPKTQE